MKKILFVLICFLIFGCSSAREGISVQNDLNKIMPYTCKTGGTCTGKMNQLWYVYEIGPGFNPSSVQLLNARIVSGIVDPIDCLVSWHSSSTYSPGTVLFMLENTTPDKVGYSVGNAQVTVGNDQISLVKIIQDPTKPILYPNSPVIQVINSLIDVRSQDADVYFSVICFQPRTKNANN